VCEAATVTTIVASLAILLAAQGEPRKEHLQYGEALCASPFCLP